MEIKIEDLVSGVLKKLDENEEIIRDKTEFGYPDASLPSLVADILPEVAEKVVKEASKNEIDEWLEFDGSLEWIAPGEGEIELPKDFLRLMVFRMSDWKHSVSSVVSAGSPTYALRFLPRAGRRGIRKSPAVAIAPGAGCPLLRFIGSTDAGAFPERCGYLPRPMRDGTDADAVGITGTLWIPRSLRAKIEDAAADKIRAIRQQTAV